MNMLVGLTDGRKGGQTSGREEKWKEGREGRRAGGQVGTRAVPRREHGWLMMDEWEAGYLPYYTKLNSNAYKPHYISLN